MTNVIPKKTGRFNKLSLEKKKNEKALPTLFYNRISSLEYRKIQFERAPKDFDDGDKEEVIFTTAYQVRISPEEVNAITDYVKNLVNHKQDSAKHSTKGDFDYLSKAGRYFQGFVGEYAFVKLGIIKFKLPLTWDDRLRKHNEGDEGDTTINDTVVDIKCKDYNVVPRNQLHYDISESKVKKCHYFVFTFMEPQSDGSILVDILGYETSDQVNQISTQMQPPRYNYAAKRVFYNNIQPMDQFFKLKF